jgi:hypothetical protein
MKLGLEEKHTRDVGGKRWALIIELLEMKKRDGHWYFEAF